MRRILSLEEGKYPVFIDTRQSNGRDIHRVRVGPDLTRQQAEQQRADLHRRLDIKGVVIRHP